MRVGLVTWWISPNYGTVLQAYALYHAIEELGCKVYMANFRSSTSCCCRCWLKHVLSFIGLASIWRWWLRLTARSDDNEKVNSNGGRKLPRYEAWARAVFKVCDIKIPWNPIFLMSRADCFVSGSDQIWNTYYKGFDSHMFLDCVGKAKRIAYSSSIGTQDVNPEYKEKVREWLSKFHSVGIRESTGVQALKTLTGRTDIVQVLDPVFLLSADEWRRFSQPVSMSGLRECMVCYMLGDKLGCSSQVEKVRQWFGLKNIIVIASAESPDFNVGGCVRVSNLTPPEFIYLIESASVVCTDSFHATSLSLILRKTFVVFKRFDDDDAISQNSRIYDLLDMFGMRERIYDDGSGCWKRPIDWDNVASEILRRRQFSCRFLEAGLRR